MPWTQEQKNDVFEQYWSSGLAVCPIDKSRLQLNPIPHMGTMTLHADCPKCGSRLKMGPADDPRKDTFRDWSQAEVDSLVTDFFQHGSGTCPVCQASVSMKNMPNPTANNIYLDCPRCTNSERKSLPRH
jgi:ssDNA-binding Zn-finger/Zn-ribbon topoisomerase 1